MKVLHLQMGDSKYRPCPLLVQYVDGGWLGVKTGKGVFYYEPGSGVCLSSNLCAYMALFAASVWMPGVQQVQRPSRQLQSVVGGR